MFSVSLVSPRVSEEKLREANVYIGVRDVAGRRMIVFRGTGATMPRKKRCCAVFFVEEGMLFTLPERERESPVVRCKGVYIVSRAAVRRWKLFF